MDKVLDGFLFGVGATIGVLTTLGAIVIIFGQRHLGG